MARTVLQIYDQIVAEKQNMPALSALQPSIDTSQNLLADLTTTSKVAIWRLWAFVTAVIIHTLEVYHDKHKEDVEDILSRSVPGTLKWYSERVLEWQFGNSLVFLDNVYKYNPVVPANRIVKRVSVRDSQNAPGQVLIKVAKLDGFNQVLPLTSTELQLLSQYLDEIRFAGTRISLVSQNPDTIVGNFTIWFDGQLVPSAIQTDVDTAVKLYLRQIPFDGVFRVSDLILAIKAVPGVIDLQINSLSGVAGTNTTPIFREYISQSGYFTDRTSQGYSLTLNMQPL